MNRSRFLFVVVIVFSLLVSACGNNAADISSSGKDENTETASVSPDITQDTQKPADTEEIKTTASTDNTVDLVSISLGYKIALPFVEIDFESAEIKANIKKSITKDNVTRTFGPDQESGYQFIALEGTIKNLDKKSLPVYDFFLGEFTLDGYAFECSANNCFVYTENGETKSEVEPLASYKIMIYAKIPDELAKSSNRDFRFGFYDLFDNQELSRNRSFEKDPISLCPYQYRVQLLGTASAEPVTEEDKNNDPSAEKLQKLVMGEKISLKFVEMTFQTTGIKKDIKKTITKDHVSRTFGPEPESGFQFVYIEGRIKNKSSKPLPVYDFFLGEFSLDGYTYENAAKDCYVYTENGGHITSIEPMASYDYILCAKIPDALAKSSERTFRFGFYDQFDNYELSKNRSFEKDPISLCPYQFLVDLTATNPSHGSEASSSGEEHNAVSELGKKLFLKEGEKICDYQGFSIYKRSGSDSFDGIYYKEEDGFLVITALLKNNAKKSAGFDFLADQKNGNKGWTLATGDIQTKDHEVRFAVELSVLNEFVEDYYFSLSIEGDSAVWTYEDFDLSEEAASVPIKEWKFSDVFFNTDWEDLTTKKAIFPAGQYILWAHMIIEEGPRTQSIQLSYECTYPNGDTYSGIYAYSDGTDELFAGWDIAWSFYYTSNSTGQVTNLEAGTYSIKFFDVATGEYVGGKTVTVTTQ